MSGIEVWYYGNGNGSINENDVPTTGNYICGQVEVTGVIVTPANTGIVVGNTKQLTANVQPTNATNKNITWSSSNNNIATVDNNGLVTALSVGDVIISATTQEGNFTDICNVSVQSSTVAVTGVSVSPTNTDIMVGNTKQLVPKVTPTNATNTNVTWSSSNSTIAKVDAGGVVTAVAPGVATITVTTVDGGFNATCRVTVKSASGIDNADSDNLMIYPNPAQDILYVVLDGALKVEIYNTVGDKVLDTFDTDAISVSYLPSGIYIVKITTDRGIYSTKFIKE